jgi:4-amino-4-deoxy-L-arabinose transferase-like glycosyltransferase
MSSPNSRLPVWALVVLVVIFAVGIYFRFSDLSGRNLWTDEAWVGLAALQATPAAALAAGQSTPPLYILSVWAVARVLGGSEPALRLVSFLLAVGTLFLFWALVRSLVNLPTSLISLAALAVSPVMVYYGKELKQYSGDAFFAVLIFYLAERLRAQKGAGGFALLALAGVLGLGFSPPLVFILPVAGAMLWLSLPRHRARLALLGLIWGLGFLAYYLLFIRGRLDPNLVEYWTEIAAFPDFSGLAAFFLWLGRGLYEYFWYFLGEWGLYWGPPLLLIGALTLISWRRGRLVLYLLGPLLLALAAATLHRYPFMARCGGSRLMLFSAPFLYLVAAAGAVTVFFEIWQRRQHLVALALAGVLLAALHPVQNLKENLHPLNNREQIHPLLGALACLLKPGDLVYVYYFAVKPFEYYYRGPAAPLCLGKSCQETHLEAASGDTPPQRIWIVASHFDAEADVRSFAARLLGDGWQETGSLSRPGAVLFRYEPRQQSVAAKPESPPEPAQSAAPVLPPDTAY